MVNFCGFGFIESAEYKAEFVGVGACVIAGVLLRCAYYGRKMKTEMLLAFEKASQEYDRQDAEYEEYYRKKALRQAAEPHLRHRNSLFGAGPGPGVQPGTPESGLFGNVQ